MKLYEKLLIPIYVVGWLLFPFPATYPVFLATVGLVLLLSYLPLFYYHKPMTSRTIMWFAFVFLSSFMLEVFGVHTGLIFGSYQYGSSLGIKLLDTPLLIGLTWLFLVYTTRSLACYLSKDRWIRVVLGSILMVVFDVVLEYVAPPMRMWEFGVGTPPLQNYMSWFIMGVIYHSGFDAFKVKIDGKSPVIMFTMQFVFLLGIAVMVFMGLNV